MSDQYRCPEHDHAYYDGDQGVGDPYDDGYHDGRYHTRDSGIAAWEPWERDLYEKGYRNGLDDKDGQS